MICALCGPTEFPVTMRSFTFAGQVAYLVVCDTCRDRANTALAERESRCKLRTSLDVDTRPPEIAFSVTRSGTGRRNSNRVGIKYKPRQPGAPDQKHIRRRSS